MKKFTLSLMLIAAFGFCRAQSLTPTVVSSSGGFYSNSSGQLSFTVAEMTMVQTFSQSNSILTQGFQQPTDFGVYVPEPAKNGFSFGVFPNPSKGNVNLVLSTKNTAMVNIRLIDALGKTIDADRFTHAAGVNTYPYNWSNVSNGMYMLEVILTDPSTNAIQKSMKKINIIY